MVGSAIIEIDFAVHGPQLQVGNSSSTFPFRYADGVVVPTSVRNQLNLNLLKSVLLAHATRIPSERKNCPTRANYPRNLDFQVRPIRALGTCSLTAQGLYSTPRSDGDCRVGQTAGRLQSHQRKASGTQVRRADDRTRTVDRDRL